MIRLSPPHTHLRPAMRLLAFSLPCLLPLSLPAQTDVAPAPAEPQAAAAPAPPPAATTDVLVFTNGDQLTGKLVRSTPGNVVFHSDMAGDLTIPVAKIRDLRSKGNFVVLKNDVKVSGAQARPGPIQIENGKVTVATANKPVETYPVASVGYIIDEPTFLRETDRHPSFFYGWNGSVSAGATLVRGTQSSTTLTTAINLIRTFPTVGWLPPRNRTTANLNETYGTSSTPDIPLANPPVVASTVLNRIFHADAERDEYLSPRFFVLGEVAFDHNYSLGLALQSIYGAGVGWTPLQRPNQQLDLKVDLHYEQQGFFDPANNQDLFGSVFAETYHYNFRHGIVFTENGNVIPSWTTPDAYSANGTAALALPLWTRFAANVSATDNFINNPSPGYKKNSFQFVTGITYTLK